MTEPVTHPPRYVETTRSLLRETILRATDGLLADRRWGAITMAEVARAAGVSRQTVYNELGNREDLALAYAGWAGDQLLDEVERCVAANRGDLSGALVAAFTVFLDLGTDHPLVRSIADSGGHDDLLAALAHPRRSPIIYDASTRLVGIIRSTWAHLPPDPVVAVAELLVRLAVSHLLLPTSTPEAAARQVAEVLDPFLRDIEATYPSSG